MGHTEITLEYFTPAVSKQKRTFDEQQNSPQEWEHNDVSVERYFVNCFNLRAKPDFRKRGGAQTEHCEQDVCCGQPSSAATASTGIPLRCRFAHSGLVDGGGNSTADLGRTRFEAAQGRGQIAWTRRRWH